MLNYYQRISREVFRVHLSSVWPWNQDLCAYSRVLWEGHEPINRNSIQTYQFDPVCIAGPAIQTVLGPCLCGVSSEVDGVLQSMLACWFVSFWAEVKICCWGSSLVSPQLVTAIPSLHILRKRPNMSMKYSFSSALPLGSGIRVDSAAMRFRGWHFWTSFSRRGFTKMNSNHSRVRPIRSRDWPWV